MTKAICDGSSKSRPWKWFQFATWTSGLVGAVEIAGQRQKSGKKPRTYADYREMLKEKELDIALVGSVGWTAEKDNPMNAWDL